MKFQANNEGKDTVSLLAIAAIAMGQFVWGAESRFCSGLKT